MRLSRVYFAFVLLLCAPALVAAASPKAPAHNHSVRFLSATDARDPVGSALELEARMLSTSKKWIKKATKAITPKKKATVVPRPRSRWQSYQDRFRASSMGRQMKLAQKAEREAAKGRKKDAAMAFAGTRFSPGALG